MVTEYQADTLTPREKEKAAKFCLGKTIPLHLVGAPLGPTRYLVRGGYLLEHSSEFLYPLWVCEHLTKAGLSGPVQGRLSSNPFAQDPDLTKFPHSLPADYKGSHLDQGHMSPDADHTGSEKLKAETYYLSNMVPQAGKNFNRTIWKALEEKVRQWAYHRGECWVITGAFVHDPNEEDVATADGVVEYFVIGKRGVGVPTHLFKIIVAPKEAGSGEYESLALVMQNQSYAKQDQLDDFLESIDWIEHHTGLDFMSGLEDGIEDPLESTVAKQLWPAPPKHVIDEMKQMQKDIKAKP